MLERELLLKLAAEYGTPLFVYDGDMVVERYNDLFRFIPWERLRIHYALKANYNPALLTEPGWTPSAPGKSISPSSSASPRRRSSIRPTT